MKLHFKSLFIFLQGTISLLYGQSFHDTLNNGEDYLERDEQPMMNITEKLMGQNDCFKVNGLGPWTQYKVILSISDPGCQDDPDKRGFFCKHTVYVDDEFQRLGHAICVDTQGIAASLPTSQMLYKVMDEDKDQEVTRVYTTTRPPEEPFSACASVESRKVSVSVSVRNSVQVCRNYTYPYNEKPRRIMDMIASADINMGTLALKRKLPIYVMPKDVYSTTIMANVFPKYIVKVDTQNFASDKIVCNLRFLHHFLPRGTIQLCIKLEYVSEDFDCMIKVSIMSEELNDELRGLIFSSYLDVFAKPRTLCYVFNSARPALSIHKGSKSCRGRFALSANFTILHGSSGYPEHDDSDANSQRHVMMAVFISLVCACMLVLGVTCVCCLRIRSKRARQRARARSQSQANNNEAFTHSSVPPFPGISWNFTDPSRVAGLPSYEEVTGQQTAGEEEEEDKPDMPPSYDSIYSPTTPTVPTLTEQEADPPN